MRGVFAAMHAFIGARAQTLEQRHMRASRKIKPKLPRFPDGRIGFAVGDVHGRADLLDGLFTQMQRHASAQSSKQPIVVFLGDYVDRGSKSRQVLDLLTSDRLSAFERRFLMGNHERMMLDFIEDPVRGRRWLGVGGASTLMSYGVRPPQTGANPAALTEARDKLMERIPAAHVDFLNRLERYVECGDYLFVHAGVDPAKKLADQSDTDLFWIRDRFLTHREPLSHCVVHGHTPVRAPTLEGSRIAIDTGAFATGMLTAARLEETTVSFLTARTLGYARH